MTRQQIHCMVLALTEADQILLTRPTVADAPWSLPHAVVRFAEDPYATAHQLLGKTTGESAPLGLVSVASHVEEDENGGPSHTVGLIFGARLAHAIHPRPLSRNDIPLWWRLQEVHRLTLTPWVREALIHSWDVVGHAPQTQ